MTVRMTSPWVAIQRNPRSGSGSRRRELVDLCSTLRGHKITPRLFSVREELDLRVSEPTSREHVVAVVAAGGDGTVVDVVNRHPGLPLAVLPMGTENLLARFLDLPHSGRELGELIAEGCTRRTSSLAATCFRQTRICISKGRLAAAEAWMERHCLDSTAALARTCVARALGK